VKAERERWAQERENLAKQILQLTSKETQYHHELKGRDQTILKLTSNIKDKIEKVDKPRFNGTLEVLQLHPANGSSQQPVSALPGDLRCSSMDFHLMVSRNQDEIVRRLCNENQELKDCLKAL
jgi:hypothetical protein